MANEAALFEAYDFWQLNQSRYTKNLFIDACRGQNPADVVSWITSTFGRIARQRLQVPA